MRYFAVRYAEDDFGVAHSDDEAELFILPTRGPIQNWKVPQLQLAEGDLSDYLANDLGVRLCSVRLRQLLQSCAVEDDVLQWLQVDVDVAGRLHQYFVLHFPQAPDVLDLARSLRAGEFVVKPSFRASEIQRHAVFSYPDSGGLPLFVREDVKRAIETDEMTGMEMTPVRAF